MTDIEKGLKFKMVRELLDLTQFQLAKKLGITHWSIKKWEQGLRPIPLWVFKMIDFLFRGKSTF